MQVRVKADLQHNVQLQQALRQVLQLGFGVGLLHEIVVAGDQLDVTDGGVADDHLAEADEVLQLVAGADVRVFDSHFGGAGQIGGHDGFVAVAAVAGTDGVVLLAQGWSSRGGRWRWGSDGVCGRVGDRVGAWVGCRRRDDWWRGSGGCGLDIVDCRRDRRLPGRGGLPGRVRLPGSLDARSAASAGVRVPSWSMS